MSDTEQQNTPQTVQASVENINLETLRSIIGNLKAGLTKGCKAGAYDIDEAKVLGLHIDQLNEVLSIIERSRPKST
jgi:hypothetical protein